VSKNAVHYSARNKCHYSDARLHLTPKVFLTKNLCKTALYSIGVGSQSLNFKTENFIYNRYKSNNMVKKVSIWLTLEPLLYAEPKHLAEISKKLKRPHTTIRKQLAVFENMGLLEKEKKGRQTLYQLKKIPLLVDYLTIIEKEKLIERCKEELVLKEIIEQLHSFNNPIIIFGSAVDSVKKAGDVDILVVGKFNREKIKLLEKKLNLKFHIINVKSLKEISETLKKEIIKKHLIIQKSEEWIKWLVS